MFRQIVEEPDELEVVAGGLSGRKVSVSEIFGIRLVQTVAVRFVPLFHEEWVDLLAFWVSHSNLTKFNNDKRALLIS